MTQFFPPTLESDESEKNIMGNKDQNEINRKKTSNTNVFTYEGEFKKHSSKDITPYLIKSFTEQGIEGLKNILIFLGAILYLALFISMLNELDDEHVSRGLFFLAFIVFFTFVWIDHILKSSLEYYRDTLCRKCGKEYACSEVKKPVITEISNSKEYTVTVTRYWECKFCGNLDVREGSENITTKKGRIKSFKFRKDKCPQCGKYEVEEIMDSDVKEINNKRTTRRYYKCNYCGYKYTGVKEEQIYSGTGP